MNGHGTQDISDVTRTLNGIDANSFTSEGDMIQAVVAAYNLVSRLETPWEFLLRTCMGQVSNYAPQLMSLAILWPILIMNSCPSRHSALH